MGIKSNAFNPTQNIPQLNSKADEWISWHKTLKSKFGKKNANALWIKAWSKRGNSSANTSELRNYMSSNGVNIDSSAWDKVVDMGGDVGDFIGGAFKAGSYLTIGLGVVIVAGLGFAIYSLAKRPSDTTNAILSARTLGIK